MDRGHVGVLPRTTALADESYLDFMESLRTLSIETMSPLVQNTGHERVAEQVPEEEIDDLPIREIRRIYNELPVSRIFQRLVRSQQEMTWRRARDSFEKIQDEHLEDLKSSETKGPGKLVCDPNFHVPKYARRELHLQPGGFTDDPIGGIVYQYATKVFYFGRNDQDEFQTDIAKKAGVPADNKVERVLDMACSIGQCTLPLKERFPDAEVWGLDVAAPMVRYAHKRATDLDIDVNFIQALAEDTGFPDNHFDLINAYIIFHEVPSRITPKIVKEAFRILRPGGVFSIVDFPNQNQKISPGYRFIIDYDSRDNCEPYSPGFVSMDFASVLEEAGFKVTPGTPLEKPYGDFLQSINAIRE